MKIFIDGKEIKGSEVRVITQVGDESEHELHTILTYEGVIFDAVSPEGNVSLTSSQTYTEVFERIESEAFDLLNDMASEEIVDI